MKQRVSMIWTHDEQESSVPEGRERVRPLGDLHEWKLLVVSCSYQSPLFLQIGASNECCEREDEGVKFGIGLGDILIEAREACVRPFCLDTVKQASTFWGPNPLSLLNNPIRDITYIVSVLRCA